MKAIITGACGGIGTALSIELLKKGFTILGIDNFISNTRNNVTTLNKYKKFILIEKDICNIDYNFENIDYVFHFASLASPPKFEKYPQETIDVNTIGTKNMLEIAKHNNAIFMFASTSEIYGEPLVHPQPETYNGNVNPYAIRSVYDESKRLGETIVNLYNQRFNVNTRIIRIFNTYSPYMATDDGRIITNFINQGLNKIPFTIYGTGKQTRSFQYVDDLVNGIIKLIGVNYHAPINLGNPIELTVLDMAEKVAEILNAPKEFIFKPAIDNDPSRRCPDISLAKKILNWQPKISLEIGLENMIEYYTKSNWKHFKFWQK